MLPKISLLILLLVALLLSGCLPASPSPTPSNGAPPLVTLSAALPKIPPARTQAAGGLMVENPEYGFRLSYPRDYLVAELPLKPGIAFGLAFINPQAAGENPPNGSISAEPPLGLVVYENPQRLPLFEFFSAHLGPPPEASEPSSEATFFYDPRLDNQDPLKGSPALQYESGVRPVKFETLVERGPWVIGLYYHRDNPFDYEPVYRQMLADLEFTPPTAPAIAPLQPTPTPTACLDPAAETRALPDRETPLEVHFTSDGNLWEWREQDGQARQISDTRDARNFSFSPDGRVIAFQRAVGQASPEGWERLELWAVDQDGNNLRSLISADEIDALANDPESLANTPATLEWIHGTHQLVFSIQGTYEGIGATIPVYGDWVIDVDTLERKEWNPPPRPEYQSDLISPDGMQSVILNETSLDLVNVDGTDRREAVLTYPYLPHEEGGGFYAPQIAWAPDSHSLLAIVSSEEQWAEEATFSTWRVPLDGSPAEQVATFSGLPFSVTLSPNQRYLAYWRRASPMSNTHELHLAKFDGSQDVIYTTAYLVEVWNWAPDSVHFVFGQFNTKIPQFGSVCGGAVPLIDPPEMPADQISWVDSKRFLFVSGYDGGAHELRLGQVGGPSLLIGLFKGDHAAFVFNEEPVYPSH